MEMGIIYAIISFTIINLLVIITSGKETLRLGAMISQEGPFGLTGFLPAMELALETIKEDETLPFEFEITLNDSMCQASPAVRNFIGQIYSQTSNEDLVMLIGADCSVSTEPIAEIASTWNLVQISPASTSPRLSNNETFPIFLRTVSSDAEIVIGIVQTMKQFGWSRIALITQSENIFTFIATELKEKLASSNLQLIREFTFNSEENVTQAMNSLRNSPARIVFLNMYPEHAEEVLCQAYKHHMHYPTYAWMFFNWYLDNWWLTNSSCVLDGSVKGKSLERIIKTSLVFDHYPRIEDKHMDRVNQANITWNQYKSEYTRRFRLHEKVDNDTQPVIEDSAFLFDAIWTAALALNKTEFRLNEKNLTLKNFTYEDQHNISEIIYEEVLKVKFFGLTGNVDFLDNGDREGQVRLLQYRYTEDGNLKKVQFGRIINNKLLFDSGESDSTVYKDGIPHDEEYIRIALPLFVIYTILSIFGVIFAFICLVFNLWFRKQKLVERGSPYVNVMIVAGAIVFYTIVILFGVDENVASHTTVDGLCHARIWLVSIGFSLLYGTILAKAWKTYYIFKYTKSESKTQLKDYYLFGIVGALITADIIFLIPPTAVSSCRLRREEEEFEGNNANDLPAIIGVCTSESSITWLSFLFAYKGFILLTGLFLAFETRKMKNLALNDSRFAAMSVYEVAIVSIALTPIGFLLEHYPNVQYGITGITILLSTSVILGLIFVTKMYKVYRDPQGTKYLESNNSPQITNKSFVTTDNEETYKRRIESLNKEIQVLNSELEKLKSGQTDSEAPTVTSDADHEIKSIA